jgi:hypothetical protein
MVRLEIGIYDNLKRDGFNISIVQNPIASPAGDMSAARSIVDFHLAR